MRLLYKLILLLCLALSGCNVKDIPFKDIALKKNYVITLKSMERIYFFGVTRIKKDDVFYWFESDERLVGAVMVECFKSVRTVPAYELLEVMP